MSAASIQIIVRPCDAGRTVETSLVSGGVAEEILPISGGQTDALVAYLALVRAGSSTTGVETYLALQDKSAADAYLALEDADVIAVVDAAVTLENMSADQKTALLRYITAIIEEEDTSAVESAITGLDGE